MSASREALSQFGVPDIFRLKEREDDEGEQLHLILAVVREVSGDAASQLSERKGRRVLFSRVRGDFSSLSRNCRVLRDSPMALPVAHH